MPMKSAATKALLSLSIWTAPSRGVGNVAQFVEAVATDRRREQWKSRAIGPWTAMEEIGRVADDCKEENWDGYGANPVDPVTAQQASEFVETLPVGTPMPTVGAEPDGQLTLEWHKSPTWTLSVSVSPDGNLHYSSIIGPSTRLGTEAFLGQCPRVIVELVHRVMHN